MANSTIQQQYEGTRLSVAAYAAKDVKALLSTNPSPNELSAGLHGALVKQGFSNDQADRFIEKYTPVAALDQDGAGAVLFRINGTNQVATAIRGTETSLNKWNDLVLADGTIAQGQLPTYQTTLIANFILRETTPAGQSVPQFAVAGTGSNAADLLRATSDNAITNQLMTAGGGLDNSMLSSPQVTMPVLVQTGTVMGTGRAVGPCVDAAAHSEGSPEITTLGSAIAQCARITTVNGPGVSVPQMQSMADQITAQVGLPAQNLSTQNQLNIHTTGVSIIDGLNGGLPGDQTLLDIPTRYGGLVGSHSSIEAMNAAEAAYRDAGGNVGSGSPNHTSDYNFPDTAGAGRGAVNPETVTPPPTAFNAATALPSYSGDHAVTVQPGDTVSSIAKRYDMTVTEFSDYLKDQYGPNADLNSIVAGRKLPIPEQVYERTLGGVNGLDLPPEPSAPTSSTNAPTGTNEAHQQVLDAFGKGDQTAADLKAQYPGVQVADASGGLPNTPNPHSFSNYLDAQGASLTPQQQTALAAQLDKLGLGGEAELSFHSLPGGGALIANADGDIVGEIVQSSSGALNLKASGIDAQGNSVEVNQHISASGQSLTDAQYNAATQQQAGAMFNSLMAAGQWDHLSDLGKLSALVNLYNATDKLGEAFGASGDNLPGDLGAAAGWLSLAQGVEKGDGLIIANAINILSDRALDNALDAAFSNSAASEMAGEAVPYLSYALAIRNFSENPVQAIGTMVGTYAGEAIGMAIGGPIGAAIGGAIGGMLGGMIGDLFGDNDPPPPPEGVVHFSWDASGHIQHTIDFNQSGGGDAADSVADSVQGLLEQVVSAINAKNPSTADDVAINPYLLPKIGFSGSSAWMEVSLPDGSSMREGIHSDSFAQRLLDILQDNGGIAPAWQVQTEQAKWLHAQDQVQQLQAQRDALQETQTVNTEGGPVVQTRIAAGQEERYSALSAQIEQAQAQLADLAQDFKAGIGGQAYAGNTAYSLQGNAAESADFQTQSFGTLVVHLGSDPALQAAQTQLSTQLIEVLRDVEGDGYLEKAQSVASRDSAGHWQAVLTIDFNGDGIVQTRDILNLGGNTSEGNPTDEARLASQNADQQRNNVQWLDANGDGVLDKSDPAFAAIRLWVDINQDGVQQAARTGDWITAVVAANDDRMRKAA